MSVNGLSIQISPLTREIHSDVHFLCFEASKLWMNIFLFQDLAEKELLSTLHWALIGSGIALVIIIIFIIVAVIIYRRNRQNPKGKFLSLTLSNAEATFVQSSEMERFLKPSQPCHVGIHWIALAEYSQMSTNVVPELKSFFRCLHTFILAKLATSSKRVNLLRKPDMLMIPSYELIKPDYLSV